MAVKPINTAVLQVHLLVLRRALPLALRQVLAVRRQVPAVPPPAHLAHPQVHPLVAQLWLWLATG